MFLKLLGFIFLFIYVILPLLRLIFKGFIITQVHRHNAENEYRSKAKAQKREGSIDVDYVPPQNTSNGKKSSSKDEDYIPFEEIKD
jgi:hypothetical protein